MAFIAVRAFPLVTPFVLAFCGLSLLSAASLTWDGNLSGSGQPDGGGNWNTTDTDRWFNGSTSQVWSNTTPDSAIFGTNLGGATGTLEVSLTESITAHDLSFRAAGSATYRLSTSNASKLTLDGPDTSVIDTAADATIDTSIAGTQGFEKRGTGTLTLTGAANEYTGLTTLTAGTLRLQKSAGTTAINGDIRINGGTLLLSAANQISNNASITLDAGVLQLASQEDTIKNLTLNGGNSNGGGGANAGAFTITETLTINSSLLLNSFASWQANKVVLSGSSGDVLTITGNHGSKVTTLSIGSGGLTISGNRRIVLNSGSSASAKGSQLILGGDVNVTSGTNVIERANPFNGAQIDQGSATRVWQIAAGASTNIGVAVVGVSSGLIKNGNGTLIFGGPLSNTYTGMTTLNAGILKIGKSTNATAITGDITVNEGVLDWDASNQIADTSTLYLNGGALNLASFTETIANLYQTGGSINQGQGSNNATVTITGIFDVSGGTVPVELNSAASWSATNVRLAISGIALKLNGNDSQTFTRFTAGNQGSGGLTLAGGQHIYLNLGTSGSSAKGSELVLQGSFTADGGNSIVANAGSAGQARVNLKGGQRAFNINSGVTTIAVPIVSTLTDLGAENTTTIGGITKNGTGTLELNGSNSYSGNTIINAGTLRLRTGGSISSSPRITVAASASFDVSNILGYTLVSNQTLEGGGTILGDVSISQGAALSAGTIGGDITQVLTFTSSLTLEWDSTTVFDLGSGANYDRIIVEGNFVQEAGAQILFQPNGFSPTAGGTYNFFTFFGDSLFAMPFGNLFRTGADDNGSMFDLPDISASGMYWDLTQLASHGTISITPEPSRALLITGGLAALLLRRRRDTY